METAMIQEMCGRAEKRVNPRIELEVQVRISRPLGHSMVHGWMQDISDGGFKIRPYVPLTAIATFSEGDEIYFETFEEFFCFKGKGEIKWTSSDGRLAGVKFDELDDKSRRFLESFLLWSKEDRLLSPGPSAPGQDFPSPTSIQDSGRNGRSHDNVDLREHS